MSGILGFEPGSFHWSQLYIGKLGDFLKFWLVLLFLLWCSSKIMWNCHFVMWKGKFSLLISLLFPLCSAINSPELGHNRSAPVVRLKTPGIKTLWTSKEASCWPPLLWVPWDPARFSCQSDIQLKIIKDTYFYLSHFLMFPCSFIKQDHGINATTLQTHWTVTSSVAAYS